MAGPWKQGGPNGQILVAQLLSSMSFAACAWMTAEHTRASTMLKSFAHRSSKAAAAKHADVKAMAAGDEASQLKAKQMLMENATEGQSQNSHAMPQESDAFFFGPCTRTTNFAKCQMLGSTPWRSQLQPRRKI